MSNKKTTPTAPAPHFDKLSVTDQAQPFSEHNVRSWYMDLLTGSKSFVEFVEKLNIEAHQFYKPQQATAAVKKVWVAPVVRPLKSLTDLFTK